MQKEVIEETVSGSEITVELKDVPEDPSAKFVERDPSRCTLCTCNVPVKIKYTDVLVLEQFMREDGTVLPKELTGLCKKQQLLVERCVMQAHWAGLFPDKTTADFDRSGYKRFNRYWKDDMSMYQLELKTEQGSWYYVKRYNPMQREYQYRTKASAKQDAA
ncbi:Protein MRPS-18A [Aphelenchoides avenae]|nr:Protein MRPS-18A [Aphelenchus avenae]